MRHPVTTRRDGSAAPENHVHRPPHRAKVWFWTSAPRAQRGGKCDDCRCHEPPPCTPSHRLNPGGHAHLRTRCPMRRSSGDHHHGCTPQQPPSCAPLRRRRLAPRRAVRRPAPASTRRRHRPTRRRRRRCRPDVRRPTRRTQLVDLPRRHQGPRTGARLGAARPARGRPRPGRDEDRQGGRGVAAATRAGTRRAEQPDGREALPQRRTPPLPPRRRLPGRTPRAAQPREPRHGHPHHVRQGAHRRSVGERRVRGAVAAVVGGRRRAVPGAVDGHRADDGVHRLTRRRGRATTGAGARDPRRGQGPVRPAGALAAHSSPKPATRTATCRPTTCSSTTVGW